MESGAKAAIKEKINAMEVLEVKEEPVESAILKAKDCKGWSSR